MSYEVLINDWAGLIGLLKPGMLFEINAKSTKDNSSNFILFLKTRREKRLNHYTQPATATTIEIDDWYQPEPDLSMVLICSKQNTKDKNKLYFHHKNNRVFLERYNIDEYILRGIKITILN